MRPQFNTDPLLSAKKRDCQRLSRDYTPFVSNYIMSKIPPLGRPRPRRPPPAPPQRPRGPTPSPLSDSDPESDRFDPNRTPPPPASPIFRENVPEEKRFELPPLRPLTGKPPAPRFPTGVKQPKGPASSKKTSASRRTADPVETTPNPLEIIQTSLQQIQSYLVTLAAVRSQQDMQASRPRERPNPYLPRAIPNPSSPPTTLADVISTPPGTRKR